MLKASEPFVWISPDLWFCGRLVIESKSSRFWCLTPRHLVAYNLLLGIKLVIPPAIQVIFDSLTYRCEDRATPKKVPYHLIHPSQKECRHGIHASQTSLTLTRLCISK